MIYKFLMTLNIRPENEEKLILKIYIFEHYIFMVISEPVKFIFHIQIGFFMRLIAIMKRIQTLSIYLPREALLRYI